MKTRIWILPVLLVGLQSGCADKDKVIFVTNSSLGIDIDSKLPNVSLAYDRTEGYIAPRYENGAVPPIVASIETEGTIFDPQIRQVYATGAAAKIATGAKSVKGENELTGDASKKKLVFFGTTTTVGVKVGFGADGTPDNLVFGYKRKEFSYVPLGSRTVDGQAVDVYPSLLASIDTTTTTSDRKKAGLRNTQFFATGEAADALASNKTIRRAFEEIAEESVLASLSPDQQTAARAAGQKDRDVQVDNIASIEAFVAPEGAFDKAKLGNLVDAANAKPADVVPQVVKNAESVADLKEMIGDNQAVVQALSEAIKMVNQPRDEEDTSNAE